MVELRGFLVYLFNLKYFHILLVISGTGFLPLFVGEEGTGTVDIAKPLLGESPLWSFLHPARTFEYRLCKSDGVVVEEGVVEGRGVVVLGVFEAEFLVEIDSEVSVVAVVVVGVPAVGVVIEEGHGPRGFLVEGVELEVHNYVT